MPVLPVLLFLLQLFATLLMTGLIWFVQIVHYPLFAAVGEEDFVPYARRHAILTGYVVGAPMLLELASALLALAPSLRVAFVTHRAAVLSVILVLFLWVVTGVIQVPVHERLGTRRDAMQIRWLIRSNWLRTAAWSARSVLLLVCLFRGLAGRL